MHGWIAEEMAELCPDAVQYDDEGEPDNPDTNVILCALVTELQKLKGEMDEWRKQMPKGLRI